MTEEHPEQSIYVCDTLFEEVIHGTLFKWKELSGTEMISTMGGADSENEADKVKYLKRLVNISVIEPINLNVDKLKTAVLVKLVNSIEESHGLNEVVQKNLNERSPERPPSMQSPVNMVSE